MSSRRSRLSIYYNILKACRVPSPPTRIMFKAALNYRSVIDYINFLVNLGLLEKKMQKGRVLYKTTREGEKLLRTLENVRKVVKEL